MKFVTRVTLLTLIAVLCGCSSSLKISGDFPAPLVNPLPQSIGAVYDEDFRTYTYTETQADRRKWVIDSGSAQMQLFNTVLKGMFAQMQEVNVVPTPEAPATTDLVLHPRITDFQYSIPRETRFNLYEVWLKYNLSMYTAEGVLLADWVITAYGKTPSAFMKSEEEAMHAAVVVALRDLGANLTLNTTRVPEIRAWLADHNGAPAAGNGTRVSLQGGRQ